MMWKIVKPQAWVVALAVMVGAAGFAPGVETYHTPPDPSASGGITGVIEPAEGVQHVVAVDPFEVKCYGTTTDASGRFTFRGLPPGEYDLLIKTVGHVYEGLTLEVDPEQPSPNSLELEVIREGVAETWFTTEDYFNLKRIVRLTGDGERARMFCVQVRTKPTLDPGGAPIHAHIRRFDFVEMQRTAKVWQVVTARHVLRQEVPYGVADAKIDFTFSPDLSRILVGETVHDMGVIDLAKLSPPAREYATKDFDADKKPAPKKNDEPKKPKPR